MKSRRPIKFSMLALAGLFATVSAHAADWPQLQNGPQRLGYSPETLSASLAPAWSHGFAPERLNPQVQPVVAGGRLFIGTAMGVFHAFDAATGKPLWTRKVGGPILGTAGVEGNRVFFGCMDGCVYAMNASDGSVVWRFKSELRTGYSTAALLLNGRVYIANRGGVYFALSQQTGRPAWRRDLGVPLLMSSASENGRIFVGAMDMRVYALDIGTGRVLWRSETLPGAAFKDYWPVAYRGLVLIRPARANGGAFGTPIEWSRGPLPASELAKQQTLVEQYEKNPATKSLFILDQRTGKEAFVVPHWVTDTMNGATAPPCVDGDGLLIIPVTLHDWRGGWGRLDLEKRRVVEVLCDGDEAYFKQRNYMRGTGNSDENMIPSAAGKLVFILHTEEMNANYTGVWHLGRRDWTQIDPLHAEQFFSSNTQGGGGSPGVAAEGLLFHTSWNTLNARRPAQAGGAQ